MKYFLFFIAILFFLWNGFLFFEEDRGLFYFVKSIGERSDEDVVNEAQSLLEVSSEEVRGVQSSTKKDEVDLKNVFPIAKFQPKRKEGVSDLVVPNAHASIVLDVDSGTILHYDNGKEKRQIASLTKILTAIITVEEVNNLEEEVTIDEETVYVEGTKIGCPRSGYCIGERLKVGEKISVRSLLKAMLMNSANDSATALAKHISGSVENFSKLMNKRAKDMGLNDSNFCTPSGLETAGNETSCYSTAYDIARIAAFSMKYDVIWDIMRLPDATIFSSDGKYSHDLMNTNKLLGKMPNCLGTKTGFTPLAGRSLLLGADSPDKEHKIVAVILDNPYRWQDIQVMTDWAFESYEWN